MNASRRGAACYGAALALFAALVAGCGKRDATTASKGPAPGYARFVNSPDGLTGEPAANYLDFWFDYPAGCEVIRQGPDNEDNFVRVNRRGAGGQVVEEFDVGWFRLTQPDVETWAGVEHLAAVLKQRETANRRWVTVLTDGRAKVAGYEAYEFKCRLSNRKPGKEGVQSWVVGAGGKRLPPSPELDAMLGVTVETVTFGFAFIPQPGDSRRGVLLLTFAEGGPGPLAAAAESFRFGKP